MREPLQKIESTQAVKMTDTRSQSAGKSWAYVMGVFLGDGCVTKNGKKMVFRMNVIDEDFALAVKSALSDLTDYKVGIYKHSVKKSEKPNFALFCGDEGLALKLLDDTRGKQIIPEYIFTASREEKKAFIAGLMDSEGYVARGRGGRGMHFFLGYKSCDVWVPKFIEVLESVGLRIGKITHYAPAKPGYKAPMKFGIKLTSWVDADCHFNIARKEERVIDWKLNYRFYVRRPGYPQRLHVENGATAVVI